MADALRLVLNGLHGSAFAEFDLSKSKFVAKDFDEFVVPAKVDLGLIGDVSIQRKGTAPWKVGVVEVVATHDEKMRVEFKCKATLEENHNVLRVTHDAELKEEAQEWQQDTHPTELIPFYWDGKTKSEWVMPHKWFQGRFVPATDAPDAPTIFVGMTWEEGGLAAAESAAASAAGAAVGGT